MSISTNEEIEGSLLRGAADIDSEASPKFLKDLSDDIADIRLFVDRCYKREIKMFESRLMFVRSMIHVMTKTNAHLAIYLKHLKLNKCIEPFCISSGQFRKDKFWKQIDSICQELQNEEEGRLLKENGDKLQALLAEVETVMHDCDPIVFKKFFFRKKLDYSEGGIVKKFKQTLYENRPITMEKLRGMQAKAVMKVLEKKVFKYASQPIQQEVDMVIPELTTGFQPFGFNLTDSFIEAYAIFRRFAEKKGPMYIINYETYGQYISDNYYKFSKSQRRAIFELDIMLELIHQEMVNRDGKLAQYLTEAPQQAHYAIVKELLDLLKMTWFKEARTDPKYSDSWIETFLNEFMASEEGNHFALLWRYEAKRQELKGAIIGSLKAAGVIDDTYANISRAIMKSDKRTNKTFATYMGEWTEYSSLSWVIDYVRG